MSKQWLSVISTGAYSDTHVFIVGVFDRRLKAVAAAEELVEKAKVINQRAEEAVRREDYYLEEELEKEHGKLFGESYFAPREDWRVSVAEIKGNPLRVF